MAKAKATQRTHGEGDKRPSSGSSSTCSKAVVVVAILVAAAGWWIAKHPHHLMSLPYGFIPWAILGNQMPPFFNFGCFESNEFATWTKPGDVFATVGAKQGTNWMLYTLHLIRTRADLDKHPFVDVNVNTPWVSMLHKPGHTWADTKKALHSDIRLADGSKLRDHWDHPDYPFRVFKAHEVPSIIPVKQYPDRKFIAMVRNAEDTTISLNRFYANFPSWFRDLWGSFPLPYPDVEATLNDVLSIDPIYFQYASEWWEYRSEPNVLLLHYTDAKHDLTGTVRKIAAFVGVDDLTDEQITRIAELASIEEMQKIADKFLYVLWANDNNRSMVACHTGNIIRSGQLGEGKKMLSPEQRQRLNQAVETRFKDPELRRWSQHGGTYSAKKRDASGH